MSTHEISLVEVDRKVEENSISHEVAEQMLMEEERLESVNMGISDAALIVVSFGGKRNEQQGHSFSTLEPAKVVWRSSLRLLRPPVYMWQETNPIL